MTYIEPANRTYNFVDLMAFRDRWLREGYEEGQKNTAARILLGISTPAEELNKLDPDIIPVLKEHCKTFIS